MLDLRPRFAREVLRLLTVFLLAVFLRGDLLLLGAALRFTLRLRVVFLLFGAAFLLVVFLLRVVFLRLGFALLRVVFRLRVVFLLLGFALLRTVFLLRVVLLLFGAAFLLVVFLLRVVLLLFGAAFLRVVFLRRVVFLLLGAAFRRATLLADFLLAIVFLPFLFDFTLFFRLAEVFLFAALRFAGRRGFSITTSARGIRSILAHGGTTYKARVLLYVRVIYL